MRFVVSIFLLIFLSSGLKAQIVINQEPSVQGLMERFERLERSQETIDGWRIKIVNTTDRRKMERDNFKFNQLYPNLEAQSQYENPYYSIKVGAFIKRIDMEPLLVELKNHFPNVIPIRDKISKQEIVLALTNG